MSYGISGHGSDQSLNSLLLAPEGLIYTDINKYVDPLTNDIFKWIFIFVCFWKFTEIGFLLMKVLAPNKLYAKPKLMMTNHIDVYSCIRQSKRVYHSVGDSWWSYKSYDLYGATLLTPCIQFHCQVIYIYSFEWITIIYLINIQCFILLYIYIPVWCVAIHSSSIADGSWILNYSEMSPLLSL